jgi:A/G-specific adenine glycosylase
MTKRRSKKASKSSVTPSAQWVVAVRSRVLRWGRRHFINYPWRDDRDPWLTLIAELLLQRTRASQVLPVYEAFRKRYPTAAHLLRSGRRGVRSLTRRVGLHARGDTFLALARVFDQGRTPTDSDELRRTTGVGAYTAAAWFSLHRGKRDAIVDSNVFRWLGRMLGHPYQRDPRGVGWVNELADRLTPRRTFRDYNYAVLDFTMTICTPRDPACERCPLVSLCAFGTSGITAAP